MWIQYRTKGKDTVASIVKAFKIRSPSDLLLHKNNAFLKKFVDSDAPLPAGRVVMVPDPKGRYYIVQTRRGAQVLNEKEWRRHLANLNTHMDRTWQTCFMAYEQARIRHEDQVRINDGFPIVAWLVAAGDGPVTQKKSAKSYLDRVERTIKSRNYKSFVRDVQSYENAVYTYRKALGAWLTRITGEANNWAKGLRLVRDTSATVFSATAGVVTGGGSLAVTVAVGVGAGAGTSAVESLSEEAGNTLGRMDQKWQSESTSNVVKSVLKGATIGALESLAGELLDAKFLKPIIEEVYQSRRLIRLIDGTPLLRSLRSTYVEIVVREARTASKHFGMEIVRVVEGHAKGMPVAEFVAFLTDSMAVTPSSITKVVTAKHKSTLQKTFARDLQKMAPKIQGKADKSDISRQLWRGFDMDPLMRSVLDELARQGDKKIRAAMRQSARKQVLRLAKKQ